jgi:hypothetical protein
MGAATDKVNQPTAGSEPMSLVELFVPKEVAHDTVHELGELGNVQFKDVRGHILCKCVTWGE